MTIEISKTDNWTYSSVPFYGEEAQIHQTDLHVHHAKNEPSL